jgi:NADPH-dependent 2,4-dienoyl-CoA reductase/sulfur reductase-like enzyme/rhodanese-related sulfurtransferase
MFLVNTFKNLQRMKYLIVGAVAGGASAAARLRRLDEMADIVLFEKGAHVSFANCGLPYYIGSVIKSRDQLFVQTATSLYDRYRIDVRICTEVLSIDTRNKSVKARNLTTGEDYSESYDKLILAPGAEPIRPPLPGINNDKILTLRSIQDSDKVKQYVSDNGVNKIIIIGAGFIGLEMAENFHRIGKEVVVIEMAEQVLPPLDYPMAALVQQHLRSKGIKLRLKAKVIGFEHDQSEVRVLLDHAASETADLVLLSIGVRADTRLASSAGLRIGTGNGIWVNSYLQTSDPDIYAVGDAIEFPSPLTGTSSPTYLAGPANKQGRICANNIVLGNKHSYEGSVNTAIVKIFDLTVGITGLASKYLRRAGIRYKVSTTTNSSHASYYPGHSNQIIQLVFDPEEGRLLGAQSVGAEGVDKRIDVLSAYVSLGKNVGDLCSHEHAYAPPFSSAKDPVNIAGFVAENLINDQLQVFYWDEVSDLSELDFLLDVRKEEEYANGHIKNAVNIPLDAIREHIDALPAGKRIFVYCESGLRGYLAQRLLLQIGFVDVFNLSGGYRIWKTCMDELQLN